MQSGDQVSPTVSPRIMSIDALRGFDMFLIMGGNQMILVLGGLLVTPLPAWLTHHLEHAKWNGFTAHDLIMPLFLFIVGAAMPFSFAKRVRQGQSKTGLYAKVIRRTVILFVLGMIAQGHLLTYDLTKIHIFSNTLQAIAVGYLVAALALMHLRLTGQMTMIAVMLVGYWLLMVLVPVPGIGAGVLKDDANLARYIDDAVFGHFVDGTHYTWILSSMGFIATVLIGVQAGHLLRSVYRPGTKFLGLVAAGLGSLGLGWIWGFVFPINKHLWSSSMALWSAGWCFLLLALFYILIDVLGYRKWAFPFVVIGMNAITAYMAPHFISFRGVGDAFLRGLAPHLGRFGEPIQLVTTFLVFWLFLWYLYRNKTFLRV